MNPRLAKELRPLLLAWCVAALAAAGYLVAPTQPLFAKGEFGSFLIGLAGIAFVAGCLLLAALAGKAAGRDHGSRRAGAGSRRGGIYNRPTEARRSGALSVIHGRGDLFRGLLDIGDALRHRRHRRCRGRADRTFVRYPPDGVLRAWPEAGVRRAGHDRPGNLRRRGLLGILPLAGPA